MISCTKSPGAEIARTRSENGKSEEKTVPIRIAKMEDANFAGGGGEEQNTISSADALRIFDGLKPIDLKSVSVVIRGFTRSRPLCVRCCKCRTYSNASCYCKNCCAILRRYAK